MDGRIRHARTRKLAAIGAALVFGLALSEAALRLTGLALQFGTERGVRSADELGPGGKTFVCLGDSNTFGLWVDAGDAYPARLQDLFDERVPGGPHRVVNLGIPGLNSRQVRKRLPAVLEEYEPDGVLVLAGFNDSWAWTPDPANNDVLVDPPWYESLRLVRLARIASSRLRREPGVRGGSGAHESAVHTQAEDLEGGVDRTGREYRFEHADYTRPRASRYVLESLVQSLQAMCAEAERSATPIYLLTYASGHQAYELANRAAREVAADCAAGSIDPRAWFATQAEFAPQDLLFPDGHPREPGYELYARLVLDGLIEQRAIEAAPLESIATGLVSRVSPPVLTLERGRPLLSLRRERPGRRFALYFSTVGEGPRPRVGELELPLVDDELFRRTRADARLRGVIGSDGTATVSIADLADDPALTGRRLRAVGVSWGSTELSDPIVSRPVEFQVP